jgi:hypothetical protein
VRAQVLDLDNPPGDAISAEVVYCYGTLYHLHRPAEALEYLARCCSDLLLLETCVTTDDDERIEFVDEPQRNPSQALSGMGCRPSRLWVRRRLEELFPHVYLPLTQPSHPEFPTDWSVEPADGRLARAVFVASRAPLDSPELGTAIPEHQSRV